MLALVGCGRRAERRDGRKHKACYACLLEIIDALSLYRSEMEGVLDA